MSATLRVRLQSNVPQELKSIDSGMDKSAQTAKRLSRDLQGTFDRNHARQYRDELQQVVRELQRLGTTAEQTQQATAAIRDQTLAARELNATTQQTTVIHNQSGASLGDVAIFAGKAYLQFRLLNAIKSAAIPLWQKHRTAVLASGAALGGLVVTAGAVGLGLMAVQAAAGAAGEALKFMKTQNIGDIEELTAATTNLQASWTNLKRSILDTELVKGAVRGIASRIDTVSANVRLAQELGFDLADAVDGAESLADVLGRIQDVRGWQGAREGVRALVEDFVSATWQAKGLRLGLKAIGMDADKTLGQLGMKADRSVVASANQRTRADAQGNDVSIWLRDRDRKSAEEADVAELKRLETVRAVNAAIAEQTRLLKEAADGSEGSAERIAKHKRNLQELDKARAAAAQKEAAETEQREQRIQKLERKGHADFLKEEVEALDSLDQVTRLQENLVQWVRKLNDEHRLTTRILEDSEQRFQALEQRKLQLIQERIKAEQEYQRIVQAVAEQNKQFLQDKTEQANAELDAKLQELRQALAQAQGPGGGGLLDSLRGQWSQQQISRDVIGNRQNTAREQRLQELRGAGRVDQHGQAIGNSPQERRQNQRVIDHELAQLARQTLKDTFRELRGGKVGADEIRAAQDERVLGQARQQMKAGRLDPVVFQQLQQQLREDRAALSRQLELQGQVKQVAGIGTPAKGGAFGLQAMQQSHGGGQFAQSQMNASQKTMQQMGANLDVTQQLVQLAEQQAQVAGQSVEGLGLIKQRVEQVEKLVNSQDQSQKALWARTGGLR